MQSADCSKINYTNKSKAATTLDGWSRAMWFKNDEKKAMIFYLNRKKLLGAERWRKTNVIS